MHSIACSLSFAQASVFFLPMQRSGNLRLVRRASIMWSLPATYGCISLYDCDWFVHLIFLCHLPAAESSLLSGGVASRPVPPRHSHPLKK